jgi:hypothetical protein
MRDGQLSQLGKKVFGLFAGDLEIDGIWTKINLFAPGELAAWSNMSLLEFSIVFPAREDAFANEVGEIYCTLDAI